MLRITLAACGTFASFSAFALSPPTSILDTFGDAPGIILTDTAPFAENGFGGSNEAPGGHRYLANSIEPAVAQPNQFTFAAIQAGAYFALADAGIPLVTNLTYGFANGFGADLDLNLTGQDAFVLDWRYFSADMSLTLTVITNNAPGDNPNVAGYAQAVSASLGQTLVIPFSAFVSATPGLVDWANIDAITLNLSGPGGAGFALDSFSTAVMPVPEPSEWLLMASGLGMVFARVRRQAKRHAILRR